MLIKDIKRGYEEDEGLKDLILRHGSELVAVLAGVVVAPDMGSREDEPSKVFDNNTSAKGSMTSRSWIAAVLLVGLDFD